LTRREKSWLDERLAQLSGNERQRLYKQAARLRKSAQGGRRGGVLEAGRSRSALMEEDGPGFEKLARGPSGSLDDWVMRLLKEEDLEDVHPTSMIDAALQEGLVMAVGAGRCTVRAEGQLLDCVLRPELTVAQQSTIAVGDDVRFSRADDREPMVEEVLPRRATLSRPDPFYGHIERVVAANIDSVVIVVSVRTPPLHPKLIDRYLIAVQRGGAESILCVNKIDLLDNEADCQSELSKLRPYRELGLPILLCSSEDGRGIDQLRAVLAGRRCVFVGHSGVGKSSLTNALDPSLGLVTNTLREGDGKGRHTTTASQLYDLPGGIQVIDTPGIREFGLWKLTPEEVRWYFTEFDPFAPACKFADCSHTHEPTCAVKRAVYQGRLSRSRYESYCRILETL
jgi:ribosome biogenesis GTPase / thiamine phosphate phosphatase